jgi:protein O-GlcNAcase/histone acetyltransferase
MSTSNEFLGGVVEGFYGQPWSTRQRLQLFGQMAQWGLNTYFYAPKDDLKHRAIWREAYSDDELRTLGELIDACRQHQLRFIYGLSPGLDIQFSSPADREWIRRRFAQLLHVGCQDFALLFDDLPGQIRDADRQAYPSVAAAQCAVTNEVAAWVKSQSPGGRFLFCPTPYCDRMDRARLGGEGYLDTVGERLDGTIDILWTGPEIVSREISVDAIERLSARIRRAPVIWDNLHANDYDGRRLYAGPYSGRPWELRRHVAGILSNPNNEYPINFAPLHTLAAYLRAERAWSPRDALVAAIADWLPSYQTVGATVTKDDLLLLVDCFYLPHDEGPEAKRLYEVVERLVLQPSGSWDDAEGEFQHFNDRVQRLFDKLTQLRDRELFYAWSRRVWDLKEELQLIEGFVAQKKAGVAAPQLETHLPGTYRGGIVARLQGLLRMDEQGRLFAR